MSSHSFPPMATVALNSDEGKPEGPWLRQPRMHHSPWATELTGPRGHSPWQAVELGAGSGAGSVFIYSWNAAAVWSLFNRVLVKFLKKNKLHLAVKKQPPNSQTDVEIMDQGPKTDGFVRRACLVRAHLLAVRRPRQKPTLCWGVWTQKRKKLGENAEGQGMGEAGSGNHGGCERPRNKQQTFCPKAEERQGHGDRLEGSGPWGAHPYSKPPARPQSEALVSGRGISAVSRDTALGRQDHVPGAVVAVPTCRKQRTARCRRGCQTRGA